jgi:SAM-dependent methyltransferase
MRAELMHSRDRFYEVYWLREGKLIAEDDPTTENRKRLLALAFKKFLPGPSSGQPRGKVLDAGCVDGEFCIFIRQLAFDIVGIDIACAAIESARLRCPAARFCVGSLETSLPFHNGEFDAIWYTEVLEHLFGVHACLAELNRELREGGLLILTTPFHGLMKNLAITLVGFERHFHPYLSHIRFFTRQSLSECLWRAGFELVMRHGIGRIWPLYRLWLMCS